MAGASLLQNLFARAIPSRDPHRRIVSQKVDLILHIVAQCLRQDSFAKEFVGVVADQILTAWVVELRCDRLYQPKAFVSFG